MHTMPRRQKSFYILLTAIMAIHGSVMVVKIRENISSVSWTPQKAIKLKILQDLAEQVQDSEQKKQIVQSEDSANQEKPQEKSFLSDKDRVFDRQTVARNVDTFKKAALGNAQSTQEAKQQKTAKKRPSLKDLKLSDVGFAPNQPFAQAVEQDQAVKSIKGMKNGDPTSQGLSATNDYVQEVALGDFTHLNTVEYKFYGFFHRIRQKLEQFWGKSIQEKAHTLFRSGRRLPASDNLITSLQVTLNEKGEIVAVKILGASGVKELDDAAIESFNQAGPFPNPPKDLLVNGKATIEWGFVVKS